MLPMSASCSVRGRLTRADDHGHGDGTTAVCVGALLRMLRPRAAAHAAVKAIPPRRNGHHQLLLRLLLPGARASARMHAVLGPPGGGGCADGCFGAAGRTGGLSRAEARTSRAPPDGCHWSVGRSWRGRWVPDGVYAWSGGCSRRAGRRAARATVSGGRLGRRARSFPLRSRRGRCCRRPPGGVGRGAGCDGGPCA